MKRILNIFTILFVAGSSFAQTYPSTAENFIYTKNCLDADCVRKTETVEYFDGLGRPVQTIAIKATPLGRDVVTPIEYNPLGKQVKDYLPIPQPGTQDGAIYGNPLDNASAAGYGNEKIYSEKIYDNVYTNRVKQVISVGTAWAQKPIDMGYDTNINGEVKKYTITTNWLENRTDSGIALSGNYAANQLMKTTITDEDLNTTTEFKNGEGKTVLVRKNDGTKDIDTYYLYNEFGQLVYVLPPLAVATTAPDQTKLDALCYQYRYDGVGKLVEKKLPGKGWEYIIYDQQDRIILTQDANLRTTTNTFGAKGWMFTKYDKYGRVTYTGFYPSTELRSALQNSVNGITVNPANNEERSSSSFTANGIDIYYTQNAFPKINLKIISVNYYDTYPSYSFNPAFPSTILNQTVITDVQNTSVNTKGLPVMSMVKNIEDDKWTKNYVYYDNKGRAIGGYSINHLGGYTKTETEFDFAGITKQSKVYHKRLVADTEKIITQTYEYDNQNRLKKQWHQVNGQPQELLAENFYNELLQLSQKKVGNNLQSIDYTYNVRGSVIKMNDPGNLGTKLFGYELKYQNPANTSLSTGKYNGNIAEVTWKTAADQVLRRYNYQYDPLNRLKKGTYSEPNASVPENNLYNESVVYDMNSNITSLQRNGKNSVGAAGLIDNLTYTYSGNKLNTVKDSSGNYAGYPDSSGTMITYDDNGNMKNHVDKGVLQIDYNFLNLPDYVMFDKTYNPRLSGTQDAEYNVNTRYLYRADGVKLKKTYLYGSGEENLETFTITEYVDGFQYENTASIIKPTAPLTLKFVPTSEGYYNFENNKYIYSYSDHLGNVRISYTKNGAGTQIVEENNYYPFGLNHQGYNSLGGNPAYSYGYNGKELQKETGWSDYGARMYMSDIGRWGVIDPLAEQYRRLTPYNYAANNPIMFIDPDGRKIKAPDSSGEGMSLYHGATPGMVEYVGPGSRSGILKFLGLEDEMGNFYIRTDGGGGGGDPTPKKNDGPNLIQRIGNFFSNLFGGKKSTSSGHAVKATIISMALIPEGVVTESSRAAVGTGLFSTAGLTVGAIFVPTMIGEPEFNWTKQFDATIDVSISGEISRGDTNRNGILLYRGVSSAGSTEIQRQAYNEALFGIAIPNGLRNGETAHWDMDDHAIGDNYSVFTSWTTDIGTARHFAKGPLGNASGVILSKRFKIGVNAIPNVLREGRKMQENEWLIFGPVIRANVQYVKP
ncbi:DUF6443 domain-containing protein [Chryseobacterium sp. LAM-KRS1]|uniref:DUF6443 domain-containing protein n=1 Tax=Chryseobacterium sp. LAM-KRS1 TaxID=2715754 RepID=UPI0015565937|nr:DUF6443 domain-containing protein [Chryseobacterium sp. LAM-KRS1]